MQLQPDNNNDWINQRDKNYLKYTSLASDNSVSSIFNSHAMGIITNRDPWVYGFDSSQVKKNVNKLISNYENELKLTKLNPSYKPTRDEKKIKWTIDLERLFDKKIDIEFKNNKLKLALYRPFTKKWLYYDKNLVYAPGQYYTKWGDENKAIITTGTGGSKGFSTLVTNTILDKQSLMNSQGFMRYDNSATKETELISKSNNNMNQKFADKLGLSLDDTFAYVYGLLNSKEYQEMYANDLKKDLARIPIVNNKETYVEVGKKLIDLHINYEEVPIYENVDITTSGDVDYKVKKMKFAKKKDSETGKKVNDRSTIIFNDSLSISNIPKKAYEYIVNGRSAIEWIMDQYQVKTDKKSGIIDDPNDFSEDPKYIFNLLLRIINVSVQTVDLINQLPPLALEK